MEGLYMDEMEQIEKVFKCLDETTRLISEHQNISYLEALIETTENIYTKEIEEPLDEETEQQLARIYECIHKQKPRKAVLQKAFQFAVIKGMNDDPSFNYQPTPDVISLLIAHLMQLVIPKEKLPTILDVAVGTGNLMFHIKKALPQVELIGVDADPLLLRLAYVQANLLEEKIELYHQDSVMPLYLDPVDIICSDLPVGYYPNNDIAKTFQVKEVGDNHTYVHHLLIEQSLRYLKKDGYAFFLIPNDLFVSKQAIHLKKMIEKEAIIYGVIQLPISLFKYEYNARSILFLRKKNEQVKKPKQALLASLPTFQHKEEVRNVMKEINIWVEENKDCF